LSLGFIEIDTQCSKGLDPRTIDKPFTPSESQAEIAEIYDI